jgi:hypothetical protein
VTTKLTLAASDSYVIVGELDDPRYDPVGQCTTVTRYQVTLTIDTRRIFSALGRKAAGTKRGRATAFEGKLKADVRVIAAEGFVVKGAV